MKKLLPILLLIVGAYLIYQGYTDYANSKASLEIGGLEVSAQSGDSTQSIILMVIGALSVVGGLFLIKK